jgi:hypothetical protein
MRRNNGSDLYQLLVHFQVKTMSSFADWILYGKRNRKLPKAS